MLAFQLSPLKILILSWDMGHCWQ